MPKNRKRSKRQTRRPQRPTKRPGRLSVSIIGAGRLGTALGIALSSVGYRVRLVVAKHALSARRAARLIGGDTMGLSSAQLHRLTQTHHTLFDRNSLVLIATPDDAIAPVAEELAVIYRSLRDRTRGRLPKTNVVLHTSGALTSSVLRPLSQEGFATGSLHPLVSISDPKSGAELLTRAFFSVEGDSAANRASRTIVRDLGGQSFAIKPDAKALYHAAALMASPNLTALIDIAIEMLSRCGLTRNRARRVLLPLVESTIANLSTQDPARALTGTFKRGDAATVRKHLAAIESDKLRDALEAYILLGRRSLTLANRHTKEIDQLLTDASS